MCPRNALLAMGGNLNRQDLARLTQQLK